MRIGVCISFDRMDIAAKAGFDYIEANLSKISELTEKEFDDLLKTVGTLSIPVEAVNGFYPPSLAIVGADRDMKKITDYTQRALTRAAKLGVKIAVLGSGGARTVPDGYPYKTAYNEFLEVLRLCGEIARPLGITVAIEPLRKEEVNLINTVEEGIKLCDAADHPNVKCLADFYHVACNGEGYDAITTAGDKLCHIHIARPSDRKAFRTREDADILNVWLKLLDSVGYDGRISLECSLGKEPDVESALKTVRYIFESELKNIRELS